MQFNKTLKRKEKTMIGTATTLSELFYNKKYMKSFRVLFRNERGLKIVIKTQRVRLEVELKVCSVTTTKLKRETEVFYS